MRLHLAILAFLIACGDRTAAFRPTENVTARGQNGQPAAAYEIRRDAQQPAHVRVNVWSRGAYVEDGRTYVELGMTVRNTGDRSVRLADRTLVLEPFAKTGAPLAPAQLVGIEGDTPGAAVPREAAGTFRLRFALPDGVEPGTLGSLRLRWGIVHDDGQQYVQFTEFQRVREQPTTQTAWIYYDPVFGYYDPFLHGWGHHHHVPVGRVIVTERFRDHRRAR